MSKENKRKICSIIVDRANYGRIWPVLKEIKKSPNLELQVVCSGTMLLDRFGCPEKKVREDGFEIDGHIYTELEGSVPVSMAKSVGFGIIEFASELQRLKPDMLLAIGDRYEMLAATIAAAYMNIPIAHIQGGEISGSIDECARHAITKFSQFHFPSTKRSGEYIVKMGENPANVFVTGCPMGDYILKLDSELPKNIFTASSGTGIGADISADEEFLLVILHPVTTEFGLETGETDILIEALHEIKKPTVWLWPNIDAGADHISKSIRIYREKYKPNWLHLKKNIEPVLFQKVLKRCACAIGNSSSFVRDTTFSGTPVVLIGNRQSGREHGENAVSVPFDKRMIIESVDKQLKHGRYPQSLLYGDGKASERIVKALSEVDLFVQKKLHYAVG